VFSWDTTLALASLLCSLDPRIVLAYPNWGSVTRKGLRFDFFGAIPRSTQFRVQQLILRSLSTRSQNALKRKGWETPEDEVPVMVDIHNFLNEACWQEIIKWEKMHECECANPLLLRFQGRPNDLSPRARMMTTFFGWVLSGADAAEE
jgi:hypothetical protein